ncbi:MAG: VOC family protein [Dehalococcoidia bacterium]|nr:VOC family protein [Dehalococcoidia bacterium]
MANPVVHFEINSQNAARMREFYSGLFGWEMSEMPEMSYTMVMPGTDPGINGGIGQVDNPDEAWATFYVEVDDPQRYLDEAVAKGGTVVSPVMEIPGVVTTAVFADPDGHRIGLVKSAPPQ